MNYAHIHFPELLETPPQPNCPPYSDLHMFKRNFIRPGSGIVVEQRCCLHRLPPNKRHPLSRGKKRFLRSLLVGNRKRDLDLAAIRLMPCYDIG
jgi:hypothetical protein